jgi:biotin carboxylase
MVSGVEEEPVESIDTKKDIILTINGVEPDLVKAVQQHSQELGRQLKGIVLVHSDYAQAPHRPKDESGVFEEIVCNCNDQNEVQRILKPLADRILAVTYRFENSVEPLRRVLPFLPYTYAPSDSALLWCTDKTLMRDRLSNYDRSLTPRYQYLEEPDLLRLQELVGDFHFPVIVKPSGLAKSLLVERCESMIELNHQLETTFSVINDVYEREYRLTRPGVLVEEFIEGDMYSTDAYVTHDGEIFCLPLVRVITADSIGLPGFYSYRHIVPVNLTPEDLKAAFAATHSAIKALSLSSSSAHVELYRTSHGWKIIELGSRVGGYREDLYREVYGIGHVYNDLAVRMGLRPAMPNGEIYNHAAGLNIYADAEGEIESITGLEEARQLSSVLYLNVHARSGDIALFAGNGGNFIIDGILRNPDPEQLEQDVDRVRELIKIKIKPHEEMEYPPSQSAYV